MSTPALRLDPWKLVTWGLMAFMAFFIIYPLVSLLLNSFRNAEGAFTLVHFVRFFTKKYYLKTLLNSLSVSITVTLLTVALVA